MKLFKKLTSLFKNGVPTGFALKEIQHRETAEIIKEALPSPDKMLDKALRNYGIEKDSELYRSITNNISEAVKYKNFQEEALQDVKRLLQAETVKIGHISASPGAYRLEIFK